MKFGNLRLEFLVHFYAHLYIWYTANYSFYILLTVHLSIILDNDQLDTHLIYFTIRSLQSSTCFDHYMLIIRSLNCINAASVIILSVSDLPVHKFSLNLRTGRPLTDRTIPDAASIHFNLLMMSM